MVLEICTTSVQSAINAEEAGAHRVELCSELAVGGLTPSYGLIKEVVASVDIPVFVLIRPRSGNFTYDEYEFRQMLHDIDVCKELGCKGIVSGVLKDDWSIDVDRTRQLVEHAAPLPFTFHRAFDWVEDTDGAIQELIKTGVDRLLTSGQKPSSYDGLPLLKKWKDTYGSSITIMPGGGITPDNVREFIHHGFEELHTSASSLIEVNNPPPLSLYAEKFYNETHLAYSDKEKIASIINRTR